MKRIKKNHIFFIAVLAAILAAAWSAAAEHVYRAVGIIFWSIVAALIYLARPSSKLNTTRLESGGRKNTILTVGVCLFIVILCTLPMGLSPYYNGTLPENRGQYEMLAKSFLEGHLYLDIEPDPKLEALDNPYDPIERAVNFAGYPWDHAYYKGHFYMYYGVVPVVLLFLPYLAITGQSLDGYHASQIFAAFFIVGIFALFHMLVKKCFRNASTGLYLFLSVALSVIGIWYVIEAPQLYCLPFVSGICFETWSIYFFLRAVLFEENTNRQIFFAFWGALCGALVFGCRPPIGMMNIIVIPLFIHFLRSKKVTRSLIAKIFIVVIPYIVVATLLMAYNYARFDNPFEFGQTYQLTTDDNTNLGNFADNFSLIKYINGFLYYFISYTPLTNEFPFVGFNGIFISFPVLASVFAVNHEPVRTELKRKHLFSFVVSGFIGLFIVYLVDIQWTTAIWERYRLDFYYMLGILAFIVLCSWRESLTEKAVKTFDTVIEILSVASVIMCLLLFLVPNDKNITEADPEFLEKVRSVLMLGTDLGKRG